MVMTKDDFNNKILQNIGLEIDEDNCIIDEETGDRLQIRGKYIKTEVGEQDYNCIEYNPLENPTMMNKLFGYFLDKNEKETGVGTRVYSHSTTNKKEKGHVILIQEDETTITSGNYYNDSLKYADIIFKMNSAIKLEDLRPLDAPIQTRGGRNVSFKSRARKNSTGGSGLVSE